MYNLFLYIASVFIVIAMIFLRIRYFPVLHPDARFFPELPEDYTGHFPILKKQRGHRMKNWKTTVPSGTTTGSTLTPG
jgi:hypothetical protein